MSKKAPTPFFTGNTHGAPGPPPIFLLLKASPKCAPCALFFNRARGPNNFAPPHKAIMPPGPNLGFPRATRTSRPSPEFLGKPIAPRPLGKTWSQCHFTILSGAQAPSSLPKAGATARASACSMRFL